MRFNRNVGLLFIIVVIYICDAVTVSPQDFYYIKGSSQLPPQIAYYVTGGSNGNNHGSASLYNTRKPLPIKYRVKVNSNNNVFNLIESPVPKFFITQPIEASQSNAFPSEFSSVPIKNLPSAPYKNHRYRDDFNFYSNTKNNGLVPVTQPPPSGNDPPKGQKPFRPTFQIDQIQRNYQAQQEFDRQNRRLRPHFENQAIHEIPAPILYSRPKQPLPFGMLRNNLDKLRSRHREHFAVDEDEHPAQLQNTQQQDEPFSYPSHTGYEDIYRDGEKLYRNEANAYNNLKNYHHISDDDFDDPKFENVYQDIQKEMERIEESSNSGPDSDDDSESNDDDDSDHDHNNENSDDYEQSEKNRQISNYQRPHYNDQHDRFKKEEYQQKPHLRGSKKYAKLGGVKINPRTGKPKLIGLNLKVNEHINNKPLFQAARRPKHANDRGDYTTNFVPVKMLASVRHSDIISHRPKKITDPSIKERIREEGGHIVYTEEGYEDDQYDHGDAEKFANQHITVHNRRRKRSTTATNISNENLQLIYMLRGKDLLDYLDDILQEASKLLPIEIENNSKSRNRSTADYMTSSESIQITQVVTPRNKFPYYNTSPRKLSRNSPLRYSEYFNHRALQSTKSPTPYYNTKKKRCNPIDLDDESVNDKNTDVQSKKRLKGLGDQIDCMKAKLFGSDPFDNPIFREEFVTDGIESSLVYDDVIRNIKSSRKNNKYNDNDDLNENSSNARQQHLQQRLKVNQDQENLLRNNLSSANLQSGKRIPVNSSKVNNNTVTKLFGQKPFKSKPSPTILLLDDSSLAQVKNKSFQHQDKDLILLNISTFLPQQIQIRPSKHATETQRVISSSKYPHSRPSTGIMYTNKKNVDQRESLYNLPGPYPKNIVYIGPHGQVSNVFKSNQRHLV